MPHRIRFAPVRLLFLLLIASGLPLKGASQAQPPAASAPQSPAAPAQTAAPEAVKNKPAAQVIKPYSLPPETARKAEDLSRAYVRLYFLGFAYGLLMYLLVLRGRIAPKFRDWAERVSPRRLVQAGVFVPMLLLTLAALNLPRRIYGHWLGLKYGLSIQGWGSWAWDRVKAEILVVVFGTFVAWILYAVIRRSPRRWWFYFWLASLPIILFVVFVEPVVVEPLFYKFEPLAKKQPQLVAEIEKVTQRAGLAIPRERMFEMKASEKLRVVNAYVTGIGASKRVVVWDTTIQKMTVPETVSVFGHEMGHYVLGHIWKGIAFGIAGLFVACYLGYHLVQRALRRWGAGWTIRGAGDWASLPLLLLIFSVFNFLSTPIDSAYSRRLEHQADQFGLEVIHGLMPDAPQTAAHAFQVLGEIDLEEPNPSWFVQFWFYDHPPINDRIIFSQTYDPWSHGQQGEFVR